MKYSAYPKYKDSGVEWLGEIPEDWEIKKLSILFSAKKGSNAAQLTKEYCATKEGEFPVFSGQTENDGIMALINTYEFDSGRDGFLFSTTVGAKAMSLMHIKGKFSLSQNCMVIIPLLNFIDIRFFYYHMQPLFSFERGLIPEHMQASFRMEDLYAYRIALPPRSTQQSISTFLDTETAKIDGLIKDYEELISLLQEKRQALISHAVSRGLSELVSPDDPDFGEWAKPVKFKDSGVEWLGEIPEEWEVTTIRYHFSIGRGRVISQEELVDDGLYPVYSSQTLNDGCLGYINTYDFDCEQITWTTDGANAGTIFIRSGRHNCTNVCGTLQLITSSLNLRYIYYLLSIGTEYYKRPDTNGAKIMNNEMACIKILRLSLKEQKAIVSYLDKILPNHLSLITETESAISLLKEHRSALITNAVTGKINVEALV